MTHINIEAIRSKLTVNFYANIVVVNTDQNAEA